MNLLDKLQAWHSTPGNPGSTELKEMSQIGLRIITGYIQQQQSQVGCPFYRLQYFIYVEGFTQTEADYKYQTL